MKISMLKIPKAALNNVDENELLFYIMMGHLSNEITVLEKILFLSAASNSENQILRTINNSHIILISKLIAGKLNEGWKLLNQSFFNSPLSKIIESELPEPGKNSLRELKQYFNRANLIRNLRNEFAFHFPVDIVKNELLQTENTDILEIVVTEGDEPFFIYSEELVMKAILNRIDASNVEKALETFLKEIMSITKTFRIFCAECIILMTQKYGLEFTRTEEDFPLIPSNKNGLQSPFLFY